MALINQLEQWIYLLEPHTASRATSIALQGLGGIEVGGWHAKLQPLFEAGKIPRPLGYEVGVTVRNPIDVLITKWLKGRPEKQTLHEWMDTVDPVYYYHPLMGLWQSATTVCWYEHLEEDLRFIFGEPKLTVEFDPTHKCREDNRRAKKPWWRYLKEDQKSLDKLLDLYGNFMTKFGYDYTEVNGRPSMFIDEDIRMQYRRRIRNGLH